MNKLYEKLAVAILNKYIPPPPPAPKPVDVANAPRDAKGRVMAIRAYGESELRGPDLSPLMPASFVQRTFLYGSHHQRVAMKRALELSAKNFYLLRSLYFMDGACPFVYYSAELAAVRGQRDATKLRKKKERKQFRIAFQTGKPLPQKRDLRDFNYMHFLTNQS
jgi:hypothetical protein